MVLIFHLWRSIEDFYRKIKNLKPQLNFVQDENSEGSSRFLKVYPTTGMHFTSAKKL